MWKNIFSGRDLAQYFFFLPFWLLLPLLKGNVSPLAGFLRVLKDLKVALAKRKEEKRVAKRTDREIFTASW
jgi:hypothetical protein